MQPTQALLKRYRKLPLTTKDIKKGFYKGTRTGAMGRHTKYEGYIIDWSRVRTNVVPDLDDFKVRRRPARRSQTHKKTQNTFDMADVFSPPRVPSLAAPWPRPPSTSATSSSARSTRS